MPDPLRPRLPRRIAVRLLAAALVVSILEVVCWCIELTLDEAPVPVRAASILNQPADAIDVAPNAARLTGGRFRNEVLHPYLGYVVEPDPKTAGPKSMDALGFYGGGVRDEAGFVVAVFGGSFAEQLSKSTGRKALLAALQTIPALADSPISLIVAAMRGYKQPQQLFALQYLLALDTRIDMVINVDGFNDIVLPMAENLPKGESPLYPRGWPARVGALGRKELLALARLQEVVDWRRNLAERVRSPFLSWSRTAGLLWRRYDDMLARRSAELTEDISFSRRASRSSFLAQGPGWSLPKDEQALAALAATWSGASQLMAQTCRTRGIEYYHFLQPNQYVEGSKPMGEAEKKRAIASRGDYRRFATAGYPALREAGQRLPAQGVAFHDLTMLFKTVKKPLYVDNCCHLNAPGYEIVAKKIAEIIAGEQARQAAR